MSKVIIGCIACIIACTIALFGMAGCESPGGQSAEKTETTAADATDAADAAEASANEMLSEGQALENAVDAVGLYIDEVDDISVQLNTDDEEPGYDVEFQQNGVKYEYFVDAYTGEVYEYE